MTLIAGSLSEKETREQRREMKRHRAWLRSLKEKKVKRKKTHYRTASATRTASLVKKDKPVPPWAMRIVRELTDWNRGTDIHFRAPSRGEPDDVWQVSVNLNRSHIDREELQKITRAARGLVWYVFSEDRHLTIKMWKEKKGRK